VTEPTFRRNDHVDYRFSTSGAFAGMARVIELLSDGRYRLARLDGRHSGSKAASSRRRNSG
jgi:hypothetical protein